MAEQVVFAALFGSVSQVQVSIHGVHGRKPLPLFGALSLLSAWEWCFSPLSPQVSSPLHSGNVFKTCVCTSRLTDCGSRLFAASASPHKRGWLVRMRWWWKWACPRGRMWHNLQERLLFLWLTSSIKYRLIGKSTVNSWNTRGSRCLCKHEWSYRLGKYLVRYLSGTVYTTLVQWSVSVCFKDVEYIYVCSTVKIVAGRTDNEGRAFILFSHCPRLR